MQPELVAQNGRHFAGFAAAVLVFIVDPASRRILLLSSPAKRGVTGWEVVNGGMEAAETPVEAAYREVAEEAGADVKIRILGPIEAGSFRYDDAVTHMISISFVAAYEGGRVVPGDDMAGSDVRWASLDDIHALVAEGTFVLPQETWLFDRALQCFGVFGSGPTRGIQ
jgi:ADP-ribose pyrophosphatase YjhB (NUDIX family)